MRFIDLFCGIGGFRVALEACGHECVFSSEIDKHARDAYRANFGDTPAGDITKINAHEIPTHDIICAGFPCQPFSITGNRRGLLDRRGQLIFEVIRIAKHHKPRILILENVPNLKRIHGGDVLQLIKNEIKQIGYNVFVNTLNASDYGVPQNRARLFLVCLREGAELTFNFALPFNSFAILRDILTDEKRCDSLVYGWQFEVEINNENPPISNKPIRVGKIGKGRQGERIYNPNGTAVTLTAGSGGPGGPTGLYNVGGRVRRLHIDECKQLMGFSVGHVVSKGREGYKQLGNSVVTRVVELIAKGIK